MVLECAGVEYRIEMFQNAIDSSGVTFMQHSALRRFFAEFPSVEKVVMRFVGTGFVYTCTNRGFEDSNGNAGAGSDQVVAQMKTVMDAFGFLPYPWEVEAVLKDNRVFILNSCAATGKPPRP